MKNIDKRPELIAPAGNLAKMRTAFLYGADAVYLGLPDFSLRVRINDFNKKTLAEGIKLAHSLGKRVYVTANILAHEKHIRKLSDHLRYLAKLKPDAIVVSDPGVLSLVQKYCPKVEIHLSTQANCTNGAAAKFWYRQGVKRIILGREVILREIAEIHAFCPQVELEYFVHGAMCMAYSGRCFLSAEFLGRSGNLGDCAQPCRWQYDVSLKAAGHEEEFDLVSEKHGSYLLNSKDLCLIEYLAKLKAAGVSSYKIEGRAKSAYYLATVVGAYRLAIDNPKQGKYLFQELQEKLVHRGYTTGFLLNKKGEQNIAGANLTSVWEFCGEVVEQSKKGLLVRVHNSIYSGEPLEIILPGYDIIKLSANLADYQTGQPLAEAHGGGGGQKVILDYTGKTVPPLAVLRRRIK
ncbi:MAG TPA: U32 family peptidase [bacterium]|nr:U32 family peptidase [bacterium]HPT30108.1 U32 family peptidase [bacterium]